MNPAIRLAVERHDAIEAEIAAWVEGNPDRVISATPRALARQLAEAERAIVEAIIADPDWIGQSHYVDTPIFVVGDYGYFVPGPRPGSRAELTLIVFRAFT